MIWTNKVLDSLSTIRHARLNVSIDQEWLDAVNQERKLEQVDKVSYEAFEIIMDRLEKEWFDIVRTHFLHIILRPSSN